MRLRTRRPGFRSQQASLDGRVADFVVVGGGSAGSVVAGRLAAQGADVLVLEAGGTARRPDVTLPVGMANLYQRANWHYPSEPDASKEQVVEPYAAGRVVGGSGAINAMVYVRGNRRDYDGWAASGCSGWAYADVLPHFVAIEDWVGPPGEGRGTGGPITVSPSGNDHPLDEVFLTAAVQAGFNRNADYNGPGQTGASRIQVNQRRGLRSHPGSAFLRHGPEVVRRAKVERVLVERGRAVGVQGEGFTVRARREVLVCAGTIGSPALLLRSGIGPDGDVLDLAGVGQNFRDHLVVTLRWHATVATLNTTGVADAARAVARYVRHGKGLLAAGPWQAQLITDDFQLAYGPLHYQLEGGSTKLPRFDGLTISTVLLHPEGTGSVRLRDGDPVVSFARLAYPHDVDELRRGIGLARELIAQPALRAVTGPEIDGAGEDEVGWLRHHESSYGHYVGTCRMGEDGLAVVDPELRVRGVPGLRVIDASVMPTVPSGNTNAPSMMVGHRAAEFILAS